MTTNKKDNNLFTLIMAIVIFMTILLATTLRVTAKTVEPLTEIKSGTTVEQVTGRFHNILTTVDGETLYQFKSNDDSVWWLLTETEMGFIPSTGENYILTYDNQGTTMENKPCDCGPELECECELYDDVLLGIVLEGADE